MKKKEFLKALDAIVLEKDIPREVIIEAMEQALLTAYKKNFGGETNAVVRINPDTGDINVYSYYIVVDDYDEGKEEIGEDGEVIKIAPEVNRDAQVLLEDAIEIHPDIKVGERYEVEVTPKDFDRVAASTAKQVLTQKIREAERIKVMEEFQNKEGELMLGMLAMEDSRNYYVDIGKTRAILPKKEMIPGEVVTMGTSIKVYISKVEETTKGPLILCTRKHYGFVRRLFETEIPELVDGTIEMYMVVREPGVRSKVAVFSNDTHVDPVGACIGEHGFSNDTHVDPVGACIGEHGTRISSILKELNGEKVDIIRYSTNIEEFISSALAPAKNVSVSVDEEEKTALAIVDKDNLSLAIGKKGINIKLASKLTKYKINVKTLEEINAEGNR